MAREDDTAPSNLASSNEAALIDDDFDLDTLLAANTDSDAEPRFSWEDVDGATTADDTAPFSLAELGLSDDDIAALEASSTFDAGSTAAESDAFGLADLGLSDDELASLELEADAALSGTPAGVSASAAQPEAADDADFVPFSLSELGLSDEEIALLNEGDTLPASLVDERLEEPASAQVGPSSDQPSQPETTVDFGSWFDQPVDTSEQDHSSNKAIGSADAAQDTGASDSDTMPFSLAELGLDDVDVASRDQSAASTIGSDQPGAFEQSEDDAPFTLTDLGLDEPQADVSADQSSVHEQPVVQRDASLVEASTDQANDDLQWADIEDEATPSFAMDTTQLAAFQAQLASNPENDALRLAFARMNLHANNLSGAFEQYKELTKRGRLLGDIIGDIQDMIEDAEEPRLLRRLHRLLGDVYMKQNRFEEAMAEYSWTLPQSNS